MHRVIDKPQYMETFAERLRVFLRRRYGGVLPKAARVARDLSCIDGESVCDQPVSAESVRRWMRGVSVPELWRFAELCRFLELSPTEVCRLALTDMTGLSHSPEKPGNGATLPMNIRDALHELIRLTDEEALAAAYVSFLNSASARSAGIAGGGSLPAASPGIARDDLP